MVKDTSQKIRRFVSGLARHLQRVCKAVLLIPGMEISRLVLYA